MKSYTEGDWVVTTPVYVGSSDAVAKAVTCSHKWIQAAPGTLRENSVMDKCEYCIAVRARFSPDGLEKRSE